MIWIVWLEPSSNPLGFGHVFFVSYYGTHVSISTGLISSTRTQVQPFYINCFAFNGQGFLLSQRPLWTSVLTMEVSVVLIDFLQLLHIAHERYLRYACQPHQMRQVASCWSFFISENLLPSDFLCGQVVKDLLYDNELPAK